MAIWTKTGIPSELPPARLYLEDVADIVQIFLEAQENRQKDPKTPPKDEQPDIKLSIGTRICDNVQELPSMGNKTSDFTIAVRRGTSYAISLTFTWNMTFWRSVGLTEEETWRTYGRLRTLFDARKLFWRNLVHSFTPWIIIFGWFGLPVIVGGALVFVSRVMPNAVAPTLVLLSLYVVATLVVTYLFSVHAIVVLRPRSERAALRRETVLKSVPTIISSILTFLLGWAAAYLKRKYWP